MPPNDYPTVEEQINTMLEPKKPCTIEFMVLDPPEDSRTYHFENGSTATFKNICKMYHTASGKDMLETTDGKKYMVANKWLYIEIETDSWT